MDKAEAPVQQASPTLDAAWQAFLDRVAGPGERYDQIRALGGMAKARELWKKTTQP